MFERFTDQARRVIVLAQEEAGMLGHDWIGTEHLLLGLLHDGENAAAEALVSLGISLDAMRQAIEGMIGRGTPRASEPEHIPFTLRAKKVLELSLRESLQLGADYIGPEHILLALIREGRGVAPQVLTGAGVDLNRVRQQVIELLPGPGEEGAASFSAPASSAYAVLISDEMVRRLNSFAERLDAIERRLSQAG